MAIDMPSSPNNGDTFLATNGVNYQWDGVKWEVYVDPSLGANVWTRDALDAEIFPVNNGDDVLIKDGTGQTTMTLFSNGTITPLKFGIDSLTTLP